MKRAKRYLHMCQEKAKDDPYFSEDFRRDQARKGWSFHPTTDDWYPSFEPPEEEEVWVDGSLVQKNDGGLVACKFSPTLWDLDPKTKKFVEIPSPKVVFFGSDDFGMEKDFEYEEDARRFMTSLPSIITVKWLMSQGFKAF